MTQIIINEIRISSLDNLTVKINGNDTYLGLFETSQILKNMNEKKVKLVSRDYHKHNDYTSYKNNFMLKVVQLLDNANHNRIYCIDFKKEKFDIPFWIIDSIKEITVNKNGSTKMEIIIRNLLNEKLEDN